MPRPKKCRKVCCMPPTSCFLPAGADADSAAIVMSVEEYETLRLIDKEGFSQEACGIYMQVARTTVQQIYTDARRKVAEALVNGQPLHIQGGNYQLCDGQEHQCNCGGCRRHRQWNDQEVKK